MDRLGPAIPTTMRSAATAREVAAAIPLIDEQPVEAARVPAFVRSLLPSPRIVVMLGPMLLLLATLAALFAGWLRTERGVKAPYTRKIFHFAIFTTAGLLHLVGGLSTVALFGGIVSCVVLYAVWRGDEFPFFEALARPSDAPRRALFVLVPLATTAVGGLGANLLFGSAAQIGYLVAGWGDAIAEPVGTRWGRHRYSVPSIAGVPATRSLEGSTAVLLVGSLAALLGLSLAGVPFTTALGIAAACGIAGTLVEAISNHGLDNLTVQLAAAGTAYFFLG
jgi:phytol kinase